MSSSEMDVLKKQIEILIKQNLDLKIEIESWKSKYEALSKSSGQSQLETLSKDAHPRTQIPNSVPAPEDVDLSKYDLGKLAIFGLKKDLLPRSTKQDFPES